MKPAAVLPAAASAPSPGPEKAASIARARIALLGASGYSGQEFARLALNHPGLELAALLSREHAGAPAALLVPGVDPRVAPLPAVVHAPEALASLVEAGGCDTIVSCLPHGAWSALEAPLAAAAASAGAPVRLVDLSADHRDGSDGYVYGLPEIFRAEIAGAARVANPGCYPTAAALALLPALAHLWLDPPVTITALSGVSGAGRAAALRTSFVELDGGASIYKAGTVHMHVGEMERTLRRVTGDPIPVGFVPQLVPMGRGILLTATVRLGRPVPPAEVHAVYAAHYAGEPFVRLLDPGEWPDTRLVRGSNRCDVSVTTLHGGTHLLATAAIDNVVKGAAGQAIQNLNLMLGWPETTGLPAHGRPW